MGWVGRREPGSCVALRRVRSLMTVKKQPFKKVYTTPIHTHLSYSLQHEVSGDYKTNPITPVVTCSCLFWLMPTPAL